MKLSTPDLQFNEVVWTLLAPRHDPFTPYHVYSLHAGEYNVRVFPVTEPFPPFWWRYRGRILLSSILPGVHEGLHAIITYFQFNAERDEVFQTVHVYETGCSVVAVKGTAPEARQAHAEAYQALQSTVPLAAEEQQLPQWM